MERVSKLKIGLEGGFSETLERLVGEWKPPVLKTEPAYSNHLADYLRKVLPEDTRVEREYRHNGTTCDVGVFYSGVITDVDVMIEVKRNLQRKSDYDRLVGQIEGLHPSKNRVAIVLVGDTDPALLGRLRAHCKPYMEEDWDDTRLRLVVVGQ
jgi:hypothetical protein